ncbi:MAG: flagella basal body P-ring formation protein FlgA [Verrucomicrobia bacterium GWF2_51_19]|nr:MAG: flagella basal body P-ring formation protein FlgA [Verrucomicrobia bacterium GWF2_51_19]HCJ12284.1 flagella basal body P-ring formation protein FlgA [Opitutae bacterium]
MKIYLIFFFSICSAGTLESILAPLVITPDEQEEIFAAKPDSQALRKAITQQVASKKPTYMLTERKISEEVAVQLKKKFPADGELAVHFLHTMRNLTLPNSNWTLSILDCPNTLKTNMMLPFSIACDGEEIGRWQMPVRLELFGKAYIASRDYARGDNLDAGQFEVSSVDLLKLPNGSLVSTDTDVSKYEAVRPIKANGPLMWADIDRIPEVRKGQVVDIVASEGLLKVTAKGIAMENGSGSDFIKVRNIQSKREIHAQILNDKTVKVYF